MCWLAAHCTRRRPCLRAGFRSGPVVRSALPAEASYLRCALAVLDRSRYPIARAGARSGCRTGKGGGCRTIGAFRRCCGRSCRYSCRRCNRSKADDSNRSLRGVAIQPITGGLLAWQLGYSLHDGWIVISILLYLLTGAFWLPVVWMQIRMRNLAEMAAKSNDRLPPEYHRLFRWWFAFGFPAFGAVMLIFWLIIARPAIFSWASTESDL